MFFEKPGVFKGDRMGEFILGFLACAVIVGFWMIGTGLIEASRSKRRAPLSVVRDSDADAG